MGFQEGRPPVCSVCGEDMEKRDGGRWACFNTNCQSSPNR